MSNLLNRIVAHGNPVTLVMHFGLCLCSCILLLSMILMLNTPDLFEINAHFTKIELLMSSAVTVFVQTFIGAWLVHISVKKSRNR
ncbi:MAG: hypothetical protein RSC43_04135 [Clostridia bacterium]